jgi:hypothetical protein
MVVSSLAARMVQSLRMTLSSWKKIWRPLMRVTQYFTAHGGKGVCYVSQTWDVGLMYYICSDYGFYIGKLSALHSGAGTRVGD